MTVSVNGIAHIQLSVNNVEQSLPFWERLCNFLEMETLIRNNTTVYCIGSRTGIMVRAVAHGHDARAFDQNTAGLHHFCFRARSAEDVDAIAKFVMAQPHINVVHAPEDGEHFAPGYYSFLFEDPDGIRVEFNYVPGQGHFGAGGRLGPGGRGPANRYGDDGLTDE